MVRDTASKLEYKLLPIMQRMLAEVVVPETTTRFIETQITNKSLTNILWNILLSILLGLTGQSDLTHLRLVTQC